MIAFNIEGGLHAIVRHCWAVESGMCPHVEKLSFGYAAQYESDSIRGIICRIPSLLLVRPMEKSGKPTGYTTYQAIWDPMICHLPNHQGHYHSNLTKKDYTCQILQYIHFYN